MPGKLITPEQEKALYQAYFVQGMTVEEAAVEAGMSRRSAHSRTQNWTEAKKDSTHGK